MAATRLSQLQKRLLRWLATEVQRTKGVVASRRQELVCALKGDKGAYPEPPHLGHAGRACHGPLGRWTAASLRLPSEEQKWAYQCARSCDCEE